MVLLHVVTSMRAFAPAGVALRVRRAGSGHPLGEYIQDAGSNPRSRNVPERLRETAALAEARFGLFARSRCGMVGY